MGVQELAEALTMRGFEVSAIEPPPPGVGGAGEDAVLDLEITTNRPDCLSVFGVAREVSTIYDTPLRPPDRGNHSNTGSKTAVDVTLEDAGRCPRYAASVAHVTIGPSPSWLGARLDAAGVRPINNVVDATNYVMLELGHPTHAFDLDKLDGRELRIRPAAAGEKVHTLDGLERTLQTDMLVIADGRRPQAIAGVMGAADSEVSGGTRVVAIESAYFEPTSVRRTSKRLGSRPTPRIGSNAVPISMRRWPPCVGFTHCWRRSARRNRMGRSSISTQRPARRAWSSCGTSGSPASWASPSTRGPW